MNAKHTTGPWEFYGKVCAVGEVGDESDLYCGHVAPIPWRGYVCSIQSADHVCGISREEAEANARLIAAAPELLEALRDMVSDRKCLSEATVNFARAAIAKATGDQ